MSWPRRALFAIALCLVIGGCASGPTVDDEFPPGNPVLGESASDVGTAVVASGDGSSDQVLLAVLALCLIGAGVLLVRVERWERRRTEPRPVTE